ncbi:SGNH/GDSL hydrolase family protein [Antrihabitans sp. NCIMB 15449]|uniref:SGNH/GDSL hydrolase family protein n=1 Tax=Antrihabitans spumae TaxID=3373370 RepID=A0ABW7JLB6_9NOCA
MNGHSLRQRASGDHAVSPLAAGKVCTMMLAWRVRAIAVTASLLCASVFAGGVAAAAPGHNTVADSQYYVALGDSGAATTGVQSFDVEAPLRCAQSTANTPKLLARTLGVQLDDRTCSSAKIPDLYGSQGPGVAPQFDALGPNTKLVTLHIGANDARFTDFILSCVAENLVGRTCARGEEWSAAIQAIRPAYAAALEEIHRRSPDANVVVDGWPIYLRPQGCADALLTGPNAAYVQSKFDELSSVVSSEAAAHGAVYVETRTAGLGHDACAPRSERWIEPVLADQTLVPFHLTLRGMSDIAAELKAASGS